MSTPEPKKQCCVSCRWFGDERPDQWQGAYPPEGWGWCLPLNLHVDPSAWCRRYEQADDNEKKDHD
jgi:hypothetical protein